MSFNPGNISKADAAAYSSSDSDDNGEDDGLQQPSADPRADDFNDFNPRKRRRTGRNAKESAALGIFGSDSEDDGPGKRWKNKKDLRYKNMAFVSAGEKKLDEPDDEEEDEYSEPARFGLGAKTTAVLEEEADDDDEDEEMAGGIGLGFKAAAQGLGWTPPTQSQTSATSSNTPIQAFTKSRYDGTTPLGRGFVPSSANDPVLKEGLDDAPSAPQTPKPSAFGRGGGKTKSFAERMMAKMGYVKGQGLGAESQGRNVIIEAQLRPQGVGLGAVKEKTKQEREEEKRQARLRGEEVIDSDEEKKKKKQDRKKKGLASGAGSGASTPRRAKTKYLTVHEIKKAAPGLHIPDAFAPILDMTGPGQKTLTSSSGLLTPTTTTETVEKTEARKLAGRAQRDLGAFVEEWKTLEERKAWLDMETHQRHQELDELESEFAGLQVLASVLDEITQAAQDKQWDPVIAALRKAEATGSNNDDLASTAVAAVHPFVRDAVQGWHPLEDPKLGNLSSDLHSIQGVLGLVSKHPDGDAVSRREDIEIDGMHRHHHKSTTPYESMIYKLLFPKLVTAISQQWDVYDAPSLLTVFDKWNPLLPTYVRAQLLEHVARRLEEAITEWKPRKKQHNLPHLWIFPWLPYLPANHLDPKGTGLVPDVRRKYRQLIDVWQFDRGVVPGLKEWKNIFRPSKAQDQWKPLVMHHVLPSMARYLRTSFRVDPSDQEPYLPMLMGVLKWADFIAPSLIAEVVVAQVFPRWHDVLYQWLTNDEANYEEIGAWFEWWKEQVLPDLAALESIAAEFEKGTNMIEQALDLGADVKTLLPRPDGKAAHQPKSRSTHKPQESASHDNSVSKAIPDQPAKVAEKSFRDDIDDWCTENDLRFIPTHKSTDHGEKYIRMTARMDGKGGVMTFFRKIGEVEELVVESRKMNMVLKRDLKAEWDHLASALFNEVN
jgi:tuftelin-interacting protein 11